MARTKQRNVQLRVQIGAAIRAERDKANLTQAQLAEKLDLQTETISRLEKGQRLPTVEKLVEMAEVFQIPVATFFEHIDTGSRHPESNLYAMKISAALDTLSLEGKQLVLKVAQEIASYHATPLQKAAPRSKSRSAKPKNK